MRLRQPVVIGLAGVLVAVLAMVTSAQTPTNGRFCVRVFEDANNNAVQEPGEPAITQGVGAELRARGSQVILDSMLVQDSPTARNGEMCFTGLELGQYEILLTSAIYEIPSTDNTVFTELTETQPVMISNYSVPARAVELVNADATDSTNSDALLERALVATAGALIAMALAAFVGILIYVLMLRPRQAVATGTYSVPEVDARYRRPDVTVADTGRQTVVEVNDADEVDIDYNYDAPTDHPSP
jgi:hypothetical protein